MHRRVALVLIAVGGVGAVAAAPGSLDRLRWRKRVILVFAPENADPRLRRQRREAGELTGQADDRDLKLAEVVGETTRPAAIGRADALRRRFHVPAGAFQVLLIGKDGGVKLRSGDGLSADEMASTIDAMPMRRSEAAGHRAP